MEIDFEPMSPDWRDDPYTVFGRLREHDPIHWAPLAEAYCVSRYEDVSHVLKTEGVFSSKAMGTELMATGFGTIRPRHVPQIARFLWRARINPLKPNPPDSMISLDPPRHNRLRAIVNRGFTPRRIEAWEPRIEAVVKDCLAGIEGQKSFDVVRDLAVPLPTQIIAEMLGIGVERLDDFKRWTNTILAVASGSAKVNPVDSGAFDDLGEMFVAMRELVADRSAHPTDDLVSAIVDPANGESLSQLEMINFVMLLLAAGNETTTNLIGNATNALLEHPDELSKVVRDPSLIPAMLEEVLRFDPPVQLLYRTALRDVELAGTKIPAGSIVIPIICSANRDQARFEDPDRFDVERNAKGHLSFGFGVHFCLGASLARLEAKMAMEALIPVLPNLRRRSSRNHWVDSSLVRGRSTMELVSRDQGAEASF
jgi:cytochrome P450